MCKNGNFALNRELDVEIFGSIILLVKLVKMVFTISGNDNNVGVTNNNVNDAPKTVVWKQILVSFLASLPYFTHGVESTALTSSVHSGHFIVTQTPIPWSTTALIVAAMVSAPVYCFLADRYGRRSAIYLINLAQGASCIPLFLSETEIRVIFLHILAGVSSGGLFTALPSYIREISDDRIRGFPLAFMSVMTTAGHLTHLVMDDEVLMFLMVALVAAQFMIMLVVVESPSYLVMRGKFDKANKNMKKLLCEMQDDQTVQRQLETLKDESLRAKANGDLNLWRIVKNPIYRDIIKIGLVLNTIMVLCGSVIFLDEEKTLAQLKMAVDTERTLVLSCMVCGSFFTLVLIKFVDRKCILSLALAIMVLSTGVLAVYTQADLTIASMRLVPVLSLGALVFGYGSAWAMPIIILVEMLNFEIRLKILCLLFLYNQAIKLIHLHTFPYIEDYIGIYTLFYIFATINMFGAVYSLFIMPSVKNKSVRQIERQLKRVPILKFNTKPININIKV